MEEVAQVPGEVLAWLWTAIVLLIAWMAIMVVRDRRRGRLTCGEIAKRASR